MKRAFNTDFQHVQLFFGPSAQVCCYVVGSDFISHLERYAFADQTLQQHGAHWYFDLPRFNQLQLESIGIAKEAFHDNYNCCTICDKNFCSYRRDRASAGRQMTVVCLK